jgi:hypothetical protein
MGKCGSQTSPKNKIGSFWWKDIPRTLNTFRGFSKVTMQDGRIVRPWYDEWNNTTLFSKYLELFSYAINKNITAMQAKEIVQHHDCSTSLCLLMLSTNCSFSR